MCGIGGYVGAGSREDLEAMAARLAHRGPDDTGIWQAEGSVPAGFAFRRLAVLDPAGGRQPMLAPAGRLALVCNGEIYNHRALRAELEALGHRFASDHSDTEVLLHGYRQWGPALPERLSGMYAFAIWDGARQELFCATDPFGKKPFYYAELPGGLAFGSELWSVLAHCDVRAELDPAALARFFALGFVPEPQTPLAGVRKLGGGRRLRFHAASGRLEIERYWQFRIAPAAADDAPARPAALRTLLERAVARRLEADVPMGVLLSGGIDSACIAALARRVGPDKPLPAFTVGFEEASYDETEAARRTAAALGMPHHVERLSQARLLELADDVLGRIDEPLADPSLIPTALLCRFARGHVTVALSGDGADELFAGYDTFAALPWAEAYAAAVPAPLHAGLARLAAGLPRHDGNLSFDFKLRRALRGLGHPEPLWHSVWLGPVDLAELEPLFGRRFSAEEVYAPVLRHWAASQAPYRRDRALEYYVDFYLQSDILPKVDRASMLHALEVRSPFLDRELAAFCAGLPYRAKHAGGVRKRLLRETAAGLLPAEVLRRPKKGFGIPVPAWLRAMPRPSLETARTLGLDAGLLARAWDEHRARRADHRGLLWAWLCLDRWASRLAAMTAPRRQAA